MKRFFEFLKDMLYDSIDYLIMISVVAIVVVVIGWRISILFAEKPIETPVVSIENREEETENNEMDPNIDGESVESEESSADSESAETEETTGENQEIAPRGQVIEIVIPSGSLPSKIGDILASNGLVSSKNDFVTKSQEMNLDTKLKSGNFSIEVGTSLENIVKIIAK